MVNLCVSLCVFNVFEYPRCHSSLAAYFVPDLSAKGRTTSSEDAGTAFLSERLGEGREEKNAYSFPSHPLTSSY